MIDYIIGLCLMLFSTDRIGPMQCEMRDFSICHDDFSLNPPDGVLKENTFPWLGFIQYVQVTTGLQHPSKAPRVVLIHKQFSIAAASDMLQLPKKYKLGNLVFGDYERDEEDCGLTLDEIKMGYRCAKAYIEVPILDITPHPEYTRFGVSNSLTLVKLLRPMKSNYMVPICLPSLEERVRKTKNKSVFLIDYMSIVPRDFESERMGKKTLILYTHTDCQRKRLKLNTDNESVTHPLCSSGCGVRNGASIISHAVDGRFELIGLAVSSGLCSTSSMRNLFNSEPPLYIDVYPYNTWAVNVITAHSIPKSYPLHFNFLQGGGKDTRRSTTEQKSGWKGRTYLSGNLCFRSKKTRKRAAFFYVEKFEVIAKTSTRLNVEIQVSAGIECTIACARLMLPNRLSQPVIEGIGTYNITVKFSTQWFPNSFYFTMALSGRNSTTANFIRWLPDRMQGFWQ